MSNKSSNRKKSVPLPNRPAQECRERGYGILLGKEMMKETLFGVVDDFNVEGRRVIDEPCPR